MYRGRFADTATFKTLPVNFKADLSSNFNIMLNYKKELLTKIINEHHPDIIIGDFNTFWATDTTIKNKFIDTAVEYLKTINAGISNELVTYYNDEIINLISDKYVYMKPINENAVTNLNGKSIIDMIWYKKDGKVISNNSSVIIEVSAAGGKNKTHGFTQYHISDHNPVFGSFMY